MLQHLEHGQLVLEPVKFATRQSPSLRSRKEISVVYGLLSHGQSA